MSSWSHAKTDALLSLIDGQRSATDIAAEMCLKGFPLSRNAVLGKTHRMGISIGSKFIEPAKRPMAQIVLVGKQKLRKCLCCGMHFVSENAGHRLCDGCKTERAKLDHPFAGPTAWGNSSNVQAGRGNGRDGNAR